MSSRFLGPIFAAVFCCALPVFTYALNADTAHQVLFPTGLLCTGFHMNASLAAPYIFPVAVDRPDIAALSDFHVLYPVLPVTFLLVYWCGIAGAALSWVYYHVFAHSYQARRTCKECLGISACAGAFIPYDRLRW